jgi:hypothetical protein
MKTGSTSSKRCNRHQDPRHRDHRQCPLGTKGRACCPGGVYQSEDCRVACFGGPHGGRILARATAASAGKFHFEPPSHHSITSSARASTLAGTSRPSALAVLRLSTVSYLVGACTGRSAGDAGQHSSIRSSSSRRPRPTRARVQMLRDVSPRSMDVPRLRGNRQRRRFRV